MFPVLSKPNTVMIVDDSAFDLKIVSKIIGHTRLFQNIITMQNGKDALHYLSENTNAPANLPQLILLDIQMPEMDGFEFVEEFAQLFASVKENCRIVILSSTDDITDIERAEASPHIVRLIKKPLHPDTLKKLVGDFFPVE